MTVYMAERDLPGITMEQLGAAQKAAIETGESMTAEGKPGEVSPVYKSDISALNPVGETPAVNALGWRRGLLAFKSWP